MARAFARPLLATEHTEFDSGAETIAFALAKRGDLPLAVVMPLLSNPEYEMAAPQIAARIEADIAARRQDLEARAQEAGVPLELHVRRGAEAFIEIISEARACSADLIVIRRRGRRGLLANLLVGEMVTKVIAHAPCSVLVAPRGAQPWRHGVLVGLDPIAPDWLALDDAAAVAAACALPLVVACVAADAGAQVAAERALGDAIERVRRRASPPPSMEGEVSMGPAHHGLINVARARGIDLLVVARHGASALGRAWIGGTAQKVIGLADMPVLVHVSPGSEEPS